jgi:hypothetical protein
MKPTKTTSKKDVLDALERSLGIVSTACEKAGINRSTHYDWLKSDPEYKEAVRLIEERTIDFAESHLHALIKDKNPAAVIFFLKTKGKARGYVERQEIQVEESRPLSWFKE